MEAEMWAVLRRRAAVTRRWCERRAVSGVQLRWIHPSWKTSLLVSALDFFARLHFGAVRALCLQSTRAEQGCKEESRMWCFYWLILLRFPLCCFAPLRWAGSLRIGRLWSDGDGLSTYQYAYSIPHNLISFCWNVGVSHILWIPLRIPLWG
jgi:hypothetical protein